MGLFSKSTEQELYNRVKGILTKNNVQFDTGANDELNIYVPLSEFVGDTDIASECLLNFKNDDSVVRFKCRFHNEANSYVVSGRYVDMFGQQEGSELFNLSDSMYRQIGFELYYFEHVNGDEHAGSPIMEPMIRRDYPLGVFKDATDEQLWTEINGLINNVEAVAPSIKKINSHWRHINLLGRM